MTAETSQDSPLLMQIKKMVDHLVVTEMASEFTVLDLPGYDPEYLADLGRRINWDQTPHTGPEDKERIIRGTAVEEVLSELRRRGLCRKLGDRGQYAAFTLEPVARRPPWTKAPVEPTLTQDIKDLKDRNYQIRQDAAKRIGKLGPAASSAVAALIEALDDPSVAGNTVAEALGHIGPDAAAAVPALIARMNAKRDRETILALGMIGPAAQAAIPDLTVMLDEDKCGAARALGMIGTVAAAATPKLLQKLREDLWWDHADVAIALLKIAPEHAPEALSLLTNGLGQVDWDNCDSHARVRAAEALAEYGDGAIAIITALQQSLDDRNQNLRRAAENALKLIQAKYPDIVFPVPVKPPPAPPVITTQSTPPIATADVSMSAGKNKKWWEFWK